MTHHHRLSSVSVFLMAFALLLQWPLAEAATSHRGLDRAHTTKKPQVRKVLAAKRLNPPDKVLAHNERRSKDAALSVKGLAHSRKLHVSSVAALRPVAPHQSELGNSADALGLKSNAVMVIDQNTQEVLFNKNGAAVLPIASLTKLMTGLVITDAALSMDERITITEDDVDTLKGSSSRLAVGTTLTRGELMHLALMSSENRAAHALGRTFPGGLTAFVQVMNVKAKMLGMGDTQYVDPTGLSPRNQSSAKDLATLATEAYLHPIIRELSTSPGYEVDTGRRTLQYRNTNRLVSNPEWDIGLQKTGYISEAGRCLVMQAKVAGRELIMVFLDSAGKLTRLADAERVRRWVEKK
jgi:serine-type D-Ala-D-Ala endopeptidase (penicillin-binding protein 7)